MPNQDTDQKQLISRKTLADRWGVSVETVKRRQRDGLLTPIHLSPRTLRYDLSEVEKVESEAKGG